MNSIEKTRQLHDIIIDRLSPLLTDNYVLLDLPYHSNLGDTLIWQGELDFLRKLPYKCLYSTSCQGNVFMAEKFLRPETIILFHGGGNFGDIWPQPNDFRREVIEMYPKQRYVVLPQTIYYTDVNNLKRDADFYSHYPNVTICARDVKSYDILRKWFPNNPSLLVPDMVFCMNVKRREKSSQGALFIKRDDKEFSEVMNYSLVPKDAYVTDWIFLNESKPYRRTKDIVKWASRFDCRLHTQDWKHRAIDLYWHYILRPLNVKTAINLIDGYHGIYTTRMHAALLSIILGKEDITLFDNNYGKSSSFYETWMSDVDGIKMIKT